MPIRFSSVLAMPAVLGAAVIAYLVSDHGASGDPGAASSVAAAPAGPSDSAAEALVGTLPPNHPPIGTMTSGHGSRDDGLANAANEEPAALVWKAPSSWQSVPNTSAMRLATYRVGHDAELTVVRAGGSVEANVQRWQEQFRQGAQTDRKDRTVHAMNVTVVRIDGTFEGGGGMSGGPAEPRAGWAMLAAIVETPGTPYFFKLLGPADQVHAAGASFDSLIDGLAPAQSQ